MMKVIAALSILAALNPSSVFAQSGYEKDTISTSEGDLAITFLGHGTLMMEYRGMVIHIDPYSQVADYSFLPDADLLLLTHHHRDHLDEQALSHIVTEKTKTVLTEICAGTLKNGEVLKNGGKTSFRGIEIEAVPAYNILHKRDNGQPYHIKGEGNGYIISFGDKRVYVAGDTENIPEMKQLGDIYCAFLPMNLPFTMTPEMAADAARTIRPEILYPYHFGETDTSLIVKLLENEKSIDVRIRKMK